MERWLGDANVLDFSGLTAMDYAGIGLIRATGDGETGRLTCCNAKILNLVPTWVRSGRLDVKFLFVIDLMKKFSLILTRIEPWQERSGTNVVHCSGSMVCSTQAFGPVKTHTILLFSSGLISPIKGNFSHLPLRKTKFMSRMREEMRRRRRGRSSLAHFLISS